MVDRFVDISHHNPDPINWKVYDADPTHHRISLKATEHTKFTDDKFVERCQAAHGVGQMVMSYHFQRCGYNADQQFKHFKSVLDSSDFNSHRDWMVLDYEDIDTPGYLTKAKPNAIAFIRASAEAGFQQGIIYSYRRYLNDTGLTANDLPPGWRKLWIATYSQAIPDSEVLVPNGWSRNQIIARQYDDKASVAGITGEVDANRVVIEWVKPIVQPPTGGDWWDSVDAATALKTMEQAVKNVFRFDGDVNVPIGRLHNENFIVDLMTLGRSNFNTLNWLKSTIESVKADTSVTGDDEAKILAALQDAETHLQSLIEKDPTTTLSPAE